MGAGLSSSAALCVALAEVLAPPGTDAGSAVAVARRCQRAEHLAGDRSAPWTRWCAPALWPATRCSIDFSDLDQPAGGRAHRAAEIVVVDSGQRRTVGSSAYAARVAECAAAADLVGPLGLAHASDLGRLDDPLLRRTGPARGHRV